MYEDKFLYALPLLLIVAALYASVGHGGASGYLAVLSFLGLAIKPFVPVVLTVNVLVASISFLHFRKSGHFSPALLWPFIVTSIPAAFVGGMMKISNTAFLLLLGIALLFAGIRLIGYVPKIRDAAMDRKTLWTIALPVGLLLGFISGMIGIGGGVFLSPILILTGITDTKGAAGISSAFIVLNSISGLIGAAGRQIAIPPTEFVAFAAVGILGALIGANWGALRAKTRRLQMVLGSVLIFASVKLLLTALPFGQ